MSGDNKSVEDMGTLNYPCYFFCKSDTILKFERLFKDTMQKNSTLQLLFPKVETAHLCHSGPSQPHTTHYLRGLWKVLLTQGKYLSPVTRLPPTGHIFYPNTSSRRGIHF